MDNMGMSSSSDLYILYTSALTPPLPSMCMKPWWCHINNKLIRGPAACVIKYHQYCVSPIRQLLHWKCSNWLFKQVQVMYCIQYANGKSCHIQYTNETTVVDTRALELKCQSWNDSGIWHFEEWMCTECKWGCFYQEWNRIELES